MPNHVISNPDPQVLISKKAQTLPVEIIIRKYITGSLWRECSDGINGQYGFDIPKGMKKNQKFDSPIITPTTKAEEGNDMTMSMIEVEDMVGLKTAEQLKDLTVDIYNFAHSHALPKGIIIADTKMEFGFLDDKIILIDELLTPDSSRFWDVSMYEPGKSQPNFDKQFVRDWLNESGWDKNPPAPSLPKEVIEKTHERYIAAYNRITGNTWLSDR